MGWRTLLLLSLLLLCDLTHGCCLQILLVVGLLFAKTVYTELEVDTEMQHGLLPGALALAAKFVPTMKQARPHAQFVALAATVASSISGCFWYSSPRAFLLSFFPLLLCR